MDMEAYIASQYLRELTIAAHRIHGMVNNEKKIRTARTIAEVRGLIHRGQHHSFRRTLTECARLCGKWASEDIKKRAKGREDEALRGFSTPDRERVRQAAGNQGSRKFVKEPRETSSPKGSKFLTFCGWGCTPTS